MTLNQELFQRAKKHIPSGVNSPVRAFVSVGGEPVFFAKANGAKLFDVVGSSYIDYVCSWGAAIVGHAHREVVEAVQQAAEKGLSFGTVTEGEVALAEELCRLLPSMEKVRLTSSGTEATMSAIRLARGFSARDKIIKFEGCYHGHSDSLLVKAGSGLLTFGSPSSAGVPNAIADHTLVLEYNNSAQLKQVFCEFGEQIACVIVEPFAGNMNLVRANAEFIKSMRDLTQKYGALLIYDEVMTGFRVALGGAQSIHGIRPDLTCLGKVIGGGMPLAAFGGRADVMDYLAPQGAVYQAGTLSGNPVAVAAGLKMLEIIQRPGFYSDLTLRTQKLTQGINQLAQQNGSVLCADCIGGMFGIYFRKNIPENYCDVLNSDKEQFKKFFHAMLNNGIYLAPSAYEAGFVSSAHSDVLIEQTLSIVQNVLQQM